MFKDLSFQQKIGWNPFKAQRDIIKAYKKKRDIRLAAGTRFGKSALCAYFALRELVHNNRHVWIIAPSYDLAGKVFTHLEDFINTAGFKFKVSRRIPQRITTSWGSWVECKSAENVTGLLGEEIDLAIMDECSRMSEDVWTSYIRQRLTSRKGKSIFISTPFGRNWFWREWKRTKEANDGMSFHFTSLDGVSIDKEEWEREKTRTPIKIFQQEYEAVFLPESAGVFTNIRDCIKGELEDYNEKHLYAMGVDLGRYDAWTVVTVVDRMTNHLVYFNRFNSIDWSFQKEKIKAVSRAYGNPLMYIDATSITVGDAYVQELADEGFNVFGYKISGNIPKRQLVEKLGVMIDQKQITYPNIEELIDELESFTYKLAESGVIKYHAPDGMYDDCVISLAFACWDLNSEPLEESDSPAGQIIINENQEY